MGTVGTETGRGDEDRPDAQTDLETTGKPWSCQSSQIKIVISTDDLPSVTASPTWSLYSEA